MLQMKCTECAGIIESPFLVEIGSITCNQCQANVTVKDVYVTTRAFTMHRDTLLGRVRHYRALLDEFEREKLTRGNREALSSSAQQSLEQNYAALRELLAASRENYRLEIPHDLPMDIELAGGTSKGRLLNLSTKGAAIKPKALYVFPLQGSEVKLRLALPEHDQPLAIAAKVAWVGRGRKDEKPETLTLGVKFTDLPEKTRSCLWDYIVDSYNDPRLSGASNPRPALPN